MDGVDAFTAPPVGNVKYTEGRELLGPGYSIRAGLASGLQSLDEDAVRTHVAERFSDARTAGHVIFSVGGSHLTYDAMKTVFEEAQQQKRQLQKV